MATNSNKMEKYDDKFIFLKDEIVNYGIRQYEIGLIINEMQKEYNIYFIVSNQIN